MRIRCRCEDWVEMKLAFTGILSHSGVVAYILVYQAATVLVNVRAPARYCANGVPTCHMRKAKSRTATFADAIHLLLHLVVSLPGRLFYFAGHASPPITSGLCLIQNIRNYSTSCSTAFII
jgi:hypothetical protein